MITTTLALYHTFFIFNRFPQIVVFPYRLLQDMYILSLAFSYRIRGFLILLFSIIE